jgi:hypothetical protein
MNRVTTGLKVAKMVPSGVGNSQVLTLRFEDRAYGVHRFHKGRIVDLTGVARLGTTGRYLCFTAKVQYC